MLCNAFNFNTVYRSVEIIYGFVNAREIFVSCCFYVINMDFIPSHYSRLRKSVKKALHFRERINEHKCTHNNIKIH